MTAKTKRPATKPRPVKAPKRREELRSGRLWLLVIGTVLALAAVGGLVYAFGGSSTAASEGLPRTPDYHSLLVSPDDPQSLVLGTHNGLFRSPDGGQTWDPYTLPGQDAMNLARASRSATIWTAGHLVFAKSDDGGESWTDVRSETLPSLDLHGFAVDPRDPDTLYAALAGEGLYRSRDAGASFEVVNQEVGGSVFGLAVLPDGRILAGDGQLGLVESRDGGTTWREVLPAAIVGLAVNPKDPQRVLATGPGVYLSKDSGANWRQVLEVRDGVGPVAWSASAPRTAYAVGFDRTLRKTSDGGETWSVVG